MPTLDGDRKRHERPGLRLEEIVAPADREIRDATTAGCRIHERHERGALAPRRVVEMTPPFVLFMLPRVGMRRRQQRTEDQDREGSRPPPAGEPLVRCQPLWWSAHVEAK